MAANKHSVKLDFTKREATGTGVCRKIRSKNLIPVVLYGPDYKMGLSGTVSAKVIAPVANGGHKDTTLIELSFGDGTEAQALIREVQRHPLTQAIRHIDLYQVLKGHKVKVEVPIRVLNADLSKGVKDGGVLTQGLRFVLVEVQPSDIPEELTYDAQNMEIGDEVFLKDIVLPEGVTTLTEPEKLVIHITEPKVIEEEAPAEETEEGAAAPEVEVVAKGKAAKEEEE